MLLELPTVTVEQSLTSKARLLSTQFSHLYSHLFTLKNVACSQGFYQQEAKFTTLNSNCTVWGINYELFELLLSDSKVKKASMK